MWAEPPLMLGATAKTTAATMIKAPTTRGRVMGFRPAGPTPTDPFRSRPELPGHEGDSKKCDARNSRHYSLGDHEVCGDEAGRHSPERKGPRLDGFRDGDERAPGRGERERQKAGKEETHRRGEPACQHSIAHLFAELTSNAGLDGEQNADCQG